jgi:Terpene synthase family 2, C-terminal metal binding
MLKKQMQALLTLSDHKTVGEQQVHPQADKANEQTKELCQRYGIELPHMDQYNTMTAFMYPRTSVERLVAINLWMDFLWYIDDAYDRNEEHTYSNDMVQMRRVMEMSVRIICDGHKPEFEHVLFSASRAIHDEFSRLAHPDWLQKRFKFFLLQHLKATTYTIDDLLTNGRVDVEKYMNFRELDSGMYAAIMLIEPAFGIYLPEYVIKHPKVRRLIKLCAQICTFSNDVFSYEKEVLRLGSRFNLVSVLMESEDINFDEAVDESIRIVNQCSDDFLVAEQDLPHYDDDKLNAMVRDYVVGLKDQAISPYHWQMTTNRYRSPESPFPELRELLPE